MHHEAVRSAKAQGRAFATPTLVTSADVACRPAPATAASRVRRSAPDSLASRSTLLLVAPMLLLIFFRYGSLSTVVPVDYDYWWHVKTGQYIAETGALPRVDVFSYTAAGHPWVAHEWLTDLLLYGVQQHVGYVGNVVLFALVSTLTALAVYATCRHWGLGEPSATVLMMWASSMSIGSGNVRPQALTALLVAVFALAVTRYRRGRSRALWALPPLMALWANLHGGYIMGLVLLGLAILGEAMTQAWARRRPVAPSWTLLLVTALSAGATLLTPHGVDALLYPFQYAGTQNVHMAYISEWQSPDFHNLDQPFVLLFVPSLLLAVALGVGRRPLGATEALWGLALAAMALQSVRHIALYAIVVTPLLGARIQQVLPDLSRPLARWRRPALAAVCWPLLAVSVLQMATAAEGWEHLRLGAEPRAAGYPAGAVDYIRANDPSGNLFNEYHWGGYLIYQLAPDRRVFIDGRADVYGPLVDRYHGVARLKPDWRETLDQHDVRLALLEKQAPLADVLQDDPAWQEVYAGEVERLFVRRAP